MCAKKTGSIEAQRRLVQHGYEWHGDVLDFDLPYLQRFPEGDIVAVPMNCGLQRPATCNALWPHTPSIRRYVF